MGDISDFYSSADMWAEPGEEDMCHHPMIKPHDFKWWVQQNGKRIKVSKMTNSHIQSSINLIKRQDGWRESWIEPLKKELKSRTISSEL